MRRFCFVIAVGLCAVITPAHADCLVPLVGGGAGDIATAASPRKVTNYSAPPGGTWRIAGPITNADGRHVRRDGEPVDVVVSDVTDDNVSVVMVPSSATPTDAAYALYQGEMKVADLAVTEPEAPGMSAWRLIDDIAYGTADVTYREGGEPCIDNFPPSPGAVAQLLASLRRPMMMRRYPTVQMVWGSDGDLDFSTYYADAGAVREGYVLDIWIDRLDDDSMAIPAVEALTLETRARRGVAPNAFSLQSEGNTVFATTFKEGHFRVTFVAVDIDTGQRSEPVVVEMRLDAPIQVQAWGCTASTTKTDAVPPFALGLLAVLPLRARRRRRRVPRLPHRPAT